MNNKLKDKKSHFANILVDDKQDGLEKQETPSEESDDLFETIIVSMEVEDSCETLVWYFDSRVSKHVKGNKKCLKKLSTSVGTSFIKLVGGQFHIVHGKRNVNLVTTLEEIMMIVKMLCSIKRGEYSSK